MNKRSYLRYLLIVIVLGSLSGAFSKKVGPPKFSHATLAHLGEFRHLIEDANRCHSERQLQTLFRERRALWHLLLDEESKDKVRTFGSAKLRQILIAMDETLALYTSVHDNLDDALVEFHPIFVRNPGLLRETIALGGSYKSKGGGHVCYAETFYRARVVALALHNRATQSLRLVEATCEQDSDALAMPTPDAGLARAVNFASSTGASGINPGTRSRGWAVGKRRIGGEPGC